MRFLARFKPDLTVGRLFGSRPDFWQSRGSILVLASCNVHGGNDKRFHQSDEYQTCLKSSSPLVSDSHCWADLTRYKQVDTYYKLAVKVKTSVGNGPFLIFNASAYRNIKIRSNTPKVNGKAVKHSSGLSCVCCIRHTGQSSPNSPTALLKGAWLKLMKYPGV